MSDQEKNVQTTSEKTKNNKKTLIIIISVVIILTICFIAILAKNYRGKTAVPSGGIPKEINGKWISTGGTRYFEFDNDAGTVDFYKIPNNEFSIHKHGKYFWALQDTNLQIYYDDSEVSSKKYEIIDGNDKEFTIKMGGDEVTFKKVKKDSKAYKKIAKLKGDYKTKEAAAKKEAEAKEKAEAEAKAPKEFTVGAGSYTCGKDFNAGTYNITLVSGSGNVVSDGESDLNEIFGSDTDYDEVSSYNNAKFGDGDTLKISGSVRIKLTPSK